MVFDAPAPRRAHPAGKRLVGTQLIHPGGEGAREPGSIFGAAQRRCIGLEGHEVAGLAVFDDLGNAADGRGDHGRATSHGFEVHDAEGLVNGRAHEHARVREHLNQLRARHHLLNPE